MMVTLRCTVALVVLSGGALKKVRLFLSKSKEIKKQIKVLETGPGGQGESQVCVLDNDVNQRKMGPLHFCQTNVDTGVSLLYFFVI